MWYTVGKEVSGLVIQDKDLLGTFEQKKALVAQFNLMDDTFFSVVMEHNDAAEYLLSQLLGRNIKIIENKTQYSIRNVESHSIVLDALVEDDEHNIYDVEVQVGDKDNHERRIRYYRTAIDWSYLEKGRDYSELPEVYMIFISDFDPFDMKKVHYEITQSVKGTDRSYDSGVHIHYFNTTVKDETFLSELMHYLADSDPESNHFGALSQQVKYHKVQNEGVSFMCKAVEEYAATKKIEGKIETIKNMLKENIPFEVALKCAGLDKVTYDKFSRDMQ
ncbi:MAG: Rpn family recombination-promoting nuclease/putative transposase [Lachnospiraceae bacterium]|nr:Rpn family recombination-promoting nuclease/putative transposase [Lachnospiraceae bacterium]